MQTCTIALLLSAKTAALHPGTLAAGRHVRQQSTASLRMAAPIEPGEPGYRRQQVSGMLGGLAGSAKDVLQRAVAEVVVKKEAKSFYKRVAAKTKAELTALAEKEALRSPSRLRRRSCRRRRRRRRRRRPQR